MSMLNDVRYFYSALAGFSATHVLILGNTMQQPLLLPGFMSHRKTVAGWTLFRLDDVRRVESNYGFKC